MDKIWRLLTAIFILLSVIVLFLIGWIFSGGNFNNLLSVLLCYVVIFAGPIGITKGILVIIDYHREHQEKDEE